MAPVNKCAVCKKVPPNKEVLTCSDCESVYDLECVNVTYKRFKGMDQRQKAGWKCPECCCKQPKSGNTNTPVRPATAAAGTSEDEGDFAREIKLFRSEMAALRQEISQLRQEFTTGFDKLSQAVDGLNSRIDGLEHRIQVLEERPAATGAADGVKDLIDTIDRLQLELNDRDQELMLMDVEISGLPEMSEESTVHLATVVARKLGVDLDTRDVVSAERVGRPQSATEGSSSSGRPRALVVRLARRALRDELLRAARRVRGADTAGFGLPGLPRKFYVNERLTRMNRQLFYKARQEGSRLSWRFVWTKDGRIYAKRLPNSKAHRIRTEADLIKTFGPSALGSAPDPASAADSDLLKEEDSAPNTTAEPVPASPTTSDAGSQD